MTSSDNRIMRLEQLVQQLQETVRTLQQQAGQLQQQAFAAGAGGGGGSSAGGTYLAYPSTAVGVGDSISTAIYQCQGGSQTAIGTATLYNYLNAELAASAYPANGVICIPDGAGNFTAVSQSCT